MDGGEGEEDGFLLVPLVIFRILLVGLRDGSILVRYVLWLSAMGEGAVGG
jgi:hypothetical protein